MTLSISQLGSDLTVKNVAVSLIFNRVWHKQAVKEIGIACNLLVPFFTWGELTIQIHDCVIVSLVLLKQFMVDKMKWHVLFMISLLKCWIHL